MAAPKAAEGIIRETVAAVLQSKRELLQVVELATAELDHLTLRVDNFCDVLHIIQKGASPAEAMGRLNEHLAAQAADDASNLHASKLRRILIDPKMEVLLLGAAAMLSGRELVRALGVSRGFRSRLQRAVTFLERFPRWTTDGTIEVVARQFSGLTCIDLAGPTRFDGFFERYRSKVTNTGVATLAKGCPGLTNINLQNCGKVTDTGLAALAEGCPGLTSINLDGCDDVTDAGVVALVECCPGLTNINLSYCRNVTDAGVEALA